MISFIIPTRNNLPYLKLAYGSIRKFYPNEEVLILDDNSTDGTKEFLLSTEMAQDKNYKFYLNTGRQVGHTVLYDEGVKMASNPIFTIFHADMVCGPNYVENLLKRLRPGGVASATRIEPPLHPPGNEKIIKDFGIYTEDFKSKEFEDFCHDLQKQHKDNLSKSIFAPWAMYKKDFQAIGGHDKFFSPFPYEDSDIFQRMILAGYDIKQSWEAFVYHFTCRGHRWTKEVQKDDLFYKICCGKNAAHFYRKWGSWIENDQNCYPVIQRKYDIGVVIKNCPLELLVGLEPRFSTVYVDELLAIQYINQLQPSTPFSLTRRVKPITETPRNNIVVTFDAVQLTEEGLKFLSDLPKILVDSGEVGSMEYNIFKLEIKSLNSYEKELVRNDSSYYTDQLVLIKPEDPFYTDTLFEFYNSIKDSE